MKIPNHTVIKTKNLALMLTGLILAVHISHAQQKLPLEVYLKEQLFFDGASNYSANLLRGKLERLFAKHEGITLSDKNAPFIIEPTINILDKEIMTSAPPMVAFKMELNLSFSTVKDKKVFASTSINLRGVGTSENKAYSNAFSNIRHASQKFKSFTEQAIIEVNNYYNTSCEKIIAEAKNYISYNYYATAVNLLLKVPFGVEPCHQNTLELLTEVYHGYQNKTCSKYIDIAKIAIAARDFNAATNILGRIDPDSPCAAEMKEITNQLSDDIKEKYERRWNFYEKVTNNKQELAIHKVNAMEELFSSMGNSGGGQENIIINNATINNNERRSVAESNKKIQLSVLSPISKKNNGKVYTSNTSENIYGFIQEHQHAKSLSINGTSISWNTQGEFSHAINLNQGENDITAVLLGKDNSQSSWEINIIKVDNASQKNPPESSIIPVSKQNRIALVIGNSQYQHVPVLKNPSNDANDISKTLEGLNFNVTTVLDADYKKLRSSVMEFSRKTAASDVALVFYAGHGLEIDGTNYIVPVDAKVESKYDVEEFTLAVDVILKIMKHSNDENLNILILDACRNNPFPTGKRGGGGLARVIPPSGTLIAYATEPGNIAQDGEGKNGTYTGELINQMKVKQRIEDVFMNTRNRVEEITNGDQKPWEEGRLKGIFYLKNE